MQSMSADFWAAVHQPGRILKSKVTIRRTGYTDITYGDTAIVSMKWVSAVISNDDFEIGSAVSATFDLELKNLDGSLSGNKYQSATVLPFIGVQLPDGTVEYCPLGKFFVDTVDKPEGSITLSCFDNMVKLESLYLSNLAYPATLLQIAQEIASNAGLQLATENFPNAAVSVPTKPDLAGTTLRQALSWVAEATGSFAHINRDGNIEIAWYVDTAEALSPSNYYTLTVADDVRTPIDGVTIKVSDDDTEGVSQGTCNHPYAVVANPLLVENQTTALPALYAQLNDFAYMPYEASWQGNPALDVGDCISVTDKNGTTYQTIVTNNELDYNGGLKADTQAIAKTDSEQSYSSSGDLTSKVNKVTTDQQEIQNLMTTNFTAVNGEIENLKTQKLDSDSATVTYATIQNLNATNENVNTITGNLAQFTTEQAGKIVVNQLAAGTINAGDGVIANGAIGDAQISDVKAGKITSGTVNTTDVSIASSSGNFVLQDNTIQITDGTHTRVQIGKDGTGDYNLYLWNAAGTMLWNAAGILPDGIPNGTIRDDMVAGDASINASKIDEESLITAINSASSYIQSSKIYYDSTSQTLDVAFQNLSTTANTASTNASSAVTTANTAASNASAAVSTANSASSTASSAASNASAAVSTANAASTNASNAVSTANSASSTASSALSTANGAQSSVTALSQTVASQGTSLSVVQGQISSKIWETDITNSVSALNLLDVAKTATNTQSSITYSTDSTGLISLSGTSSSNTTINLGISSDALVSGNTYTASLQKQSGSLSGTVTAQIMQTAQATQVITNGNFATSSNNLATGFSVGYGVAVSCTNNTQTFRATAQNGQLDMYHYPYLSGHKYFIRCYVRATSTNVVLYAQNGTTVTHPGDGQYEPLSCIVTPTVSTGFYVVIVDRRPSGWDNISVQSFMAIDMGTDASNPLYNLAAAQMAALFPSYFDGTEMVNIPRVTFTNAASTTFTYDSSWSFDSLALSIQSGTALSAYTVGVQVQAGNTPTDWKESTLGLAAGIDTLSTSISNIDSSITQLQTSISLKVDSGTFNTYTSSNDSNISSLQSRMSSAEQEITADAIVSTVTSSQSWSTLSGTVSTASSNASNAVNTANSASSTASTAASNASTALSTAQSAASTASTASTNAAAAVSTANSASSTASSALSTASTAQTTANSAVTAAATAQTTANSKSRNFTSTPTVPYYVGDTWTNPSGDVMVCNTARTTGSYTASDWGYASSVTTSTITQLSDSINLKVSSGDVTNMLNVDTSGIQINAGNIDINGLVTQLNTKALYAQRISTTGSSVYGTIGSWTGAPYPGAANKTLSGYVVNSTAGTPLVQMLTGIYDVIGAGNTTDNAVLLNTAGGLRITSYSKDSNNNYTLPGPSIAMLYDQIALYGTNPSTLAQYGMTISSSGAYFSSSNFNFVYNFNFGTATTKTWGSTYGSVVCIDNTGVSEVGKYVDFHQSADSTVDYDIRLSAVSGVLNATSAFTAAGNITSNGNVYTTGSGSSINVYKCAITCDDSNVQIQNNSGGTIYLESNGGVFCRNSVNSAWASISASAFNVASLEDYKQDIVPLDSARDTVESGAIIYEYRLRDEVAQGIDHIHRGLVIGDGYATPREVLSANGCAVDQYSMIATLWRATQEISVGTRAQIASLQAQIQALQSMIADLYEKVA